MNTDATPKKTSMGEQIYTLLYIGLVLLQTVPSFAQDSGDSIYHVQHQEKVYLHFDNTGYFLRETIWFKAYVLDESNRPTDISRVLYVELVSPEGGVVKTDKCRIENGMAHGEFRLDSAYLSGFFEVRAYTRYMRNFGEDNYFSRVFPVFDTPVDGDYSLRTMFDRLRPELSKDRNLTLRERIQKARRTRNDTLPLSVQRAINTAIRYNYHFSPQPILCDTIPEDLGPGQQVTLTFRTTPGSTFSLAVTARESRIRTNYRGKISHSLFRDSSWVARSYRAQRDFNSKTDIRYAPEKDITVDGTLFKHNRRGKRIFIENKVVCLNASDDSLQWKGNTRTDHNGYWSFTLEDFYGIRTANLYSPNTDYTWWESQLRVHKWFSPIPRSFTEEETHLPERPTDRHTARPTNDTLAATDSLPVSIFINPVTVKAPRQKRNWHEMKRSLVHYSFAEEAEYHADHTIAPLDERIWSFSFLCNLFWHYFYASGPTRWMVTDHYNGDHEIPQGTIYDGMHSLPDSIKEIVVRTDYATCSHYDYSQTGFLRNIGRTKSGRLRWGKFYYGVETDASVPYHHQDIDQPGGGAPLAYMVCFIKYTPEEARQAGSVPIIRINPTSRTTVIRGFTLPSAFPEPDYSISHKGLDKDIRRTLYWNPDVKADEQGIARITFYNNSNCRTLHISAEGIGGDGNPVIYMNE